LISGYPICLIQTREEKPREEKEDKEKGWAGGKERNSRTTTFATQASQSTEVSANHLWHKQEVVIFWLTLVLDDSTNLNLL
jgi:hypothetical protein